MVAALWTCWARAQQVHKATRTQRTSHLRIATSLAPARATHTTSLLKTSIC